MRKTRLLFEDALSESQLFSGTETNHLLWSFKTFKRGEIISETQNGIACVGLIISGAVDVTSPYEGSVSVAKKGAEFGICNIFVKEQMPTVMKARVVSTVAFMPKESFADLLARDSALMYRYVRLCNQKMIYLAEKLQLMSVANSETRLWLWLLQKNENGVVAPNLPKDELAKQLCMSRASLFRAISKLEAKGKIELAGSTFIIKEI